MVRRSSGPFAIVTLKKRFLKKDNQDNFSSPARSKDKRKGIFGCNKFTVHILLLSTMGKKVTFVTLTINRPTINMRRRTIPFTKYKYRTILSRVFFSIRDKRRRRMKNKGGGGEEEEKGKHKKKERKDRKRLPPMLVLLGTNCSPVQRTDGLL